MRAVIYQSYGGPDQLRLAEVADPQPRRGEVLVQVLACGVNLSDWEALTGSPAFARLGGLFGPGKPILGSDIVGRVLALGLGVTTFQPGQRVMADVVMHRGGFAEKAVLPAAMCALVPEALSDAVAAGLPQPGVIALQGMAGVSAGQRVLINGAGGGSGTLALQLAKQAGAHVTVVDTAAKIAWLAGLGADQGMDYCTQDFAASGERWDVIFDLVASLPRCLAARLCHREGAGPRRALSRGRGQGAGDPAVGADRVVEQEHRGAGGPHQCRRNRARRRRRRRGRSGAGDSGRPAAGSGAAGHGRSGRRAGDGQTRHPPVTS